MYLMPSAFRVGLAPLSATPAFRLQCCGLFSRLETVKVVGKTLGPYKLLAGLALLSITVGCAAEPGVELTILHVNDLHARLLPDTQGRGGFAHLATVLERERSAVASHLTLHAGDMVQGTPVSTLFQGLPIFTIANGLGIDVHCLGNHEFDYGWEKIPEYVELSAFPAVSANLTDSVGNTLVPPYAVRQVGELRIAVVGAMTERLLDLSRSSNLGPWGAAPLVTTLKPVVEAASAAADMVIVLGHLSGGEAAAILEALPQVSVVVQGHAHRAWEQVLEIDGRIAVNASGYGRDVGRLRLRYDPASRRILAYEWDVLPVVASEVPPDPAVEQLVAEWEAQAADVVDVPIGRATRTVQGAELKALLETVMRDGTAAELAHMNAGGVRDILPRGELLARHVWNVMPFDNFVLTTEITGRQLIELHDTVLQSEPIEGYASLDPDRVYRLVTTDFSADQWSDRGIDLQWTNAGVMLRDMIIAWIVARESVQIP